jgi:hypothetical protein
MIALSLLILLQQPAEEFPMDDRIAAFLKGDETARAELILQGAYAIRPLQNVRDRNPERVQGLLREIKKAVAYPTPVPQPESPRSSMVLSLKFDGRSDLSPLVRILCSMEIHCYSDRIDGARLPKSQIIAKGQGIEIFEEICRQTGLDYGYFHGTIVVGMPERLWPVREVKSTELDDAGRTKARNLIEQLGNEAIEIRERATRELIQLGTGVVSLLRDHLDRDDAEIVSRCAAILKRMTAPGVAFGPSASLRQKLSEENQAVLDRLRAKAPPMRFENAKLSDIAAHVTKQQGVAIDMAPAFGAREVTIYTTPKQTLIDLLSLITQSWDLDFMIQDRKVLIDMRDRIEKLVPREK